MKERYDAIIVGSGPNGLAAALYLQQQGLNTVVIEQAPVTGGATRTEELTLPGFRHDVGSAIHPLAFSSPYLRSLPLEEYGLEWIFPEIPFAHALPDGNAVVCYKSVEETSLGLGRDRKRYRELMTGLVEEWDSLEHDILGPLRWPSHPLSLLKFGIKALLPAITFNSWNFKEDNTRTLFLGAAAHSIMPLHWLATASFGLVLSILAHKTGWPFPKGGAVAITDSMVGLYKASGGEVVTSTKVTDMAKLPDAKVILLDMTPKQILGLQNTELTSSYRKQLESYKYGAGICKVDWALSEPVPFINPALRKAGTIHFGYSEEEIIDSEKSLFSRKYHGPPYVLFSQHSVFDQTRAPEGMHTGWAYCHVPLNSDLDVSETIEQQIERAAPGFGKLILSRSVMTTRSLENYNPNLVGGDINGGRQDLTQLFTRPTLRLRPYRTSNKALYICSSSTPPGGGVHGMAGYHAARQVMKDHFK